eukprot:SAG11_NODE_397_length_9785_cov_3.709581_7_plen_230_part_00
MRFADGAVGMGRKLAAARAPLVNISSGDYNLGLFFDEKLGPASGYSAMMIQNHDASNFRFATVVWPGTATPSGDIAKVLEVDRNSGMAKPVVDAATHVAGFQIVLNAGEGRLYTIKSDDSQATVGNISTIDIILLPHSHQDAGFLVTYSHVRDRLADRCYETIFQCLDADINRTFNVAEINFFSHWYDRQNSTVHARVKQLIANGQYWYVPPHLEVPDQTTYTYAYNAL